MLAPSDAPGSMQALEVAGLDKPEPKGWWQWVTARLNGSSTASYKPLEEDVGPSDRVSPEGAGAHHLVCVSMSCNRQLSLNLVVRGWQTGRVIGCMVAGWQLMSRL